MRAPPQLARGAVARGRSLEDVLARDVERGASQQRLARHGQTGDLPALVHRLGDLEHARLVDPAEPDDLADVDPKPEPRRRALPIVLPHRLVQGDRRGHGGIGRLEAELVLRRRLRLHRAAPALHHTLQQILKGLNNVADPGHLAPPLAVGFHAHQLGQKQHGQPGRHFPRQRVRVEPHHPDLRRQVVERAERHPEAVGGGDLLQVLALQRAELVGLVVGAIQAALVGGDEDEDRLAQLDGDLVLELGVGPPRLVVGPVERLMAVASADQANHRVALADFPTKLFGHRAVIGREVVLDNWQHVERHQNVGDRFAEGPEIASGCADEDPCNAGHDETSRSIYVGASRASIWGGRSAVLTGAEVQQPRF